MTRPPWLDMPLPGAPLQLAEQQWRVYQLICETQGVILPVWEEAVLAAGADDVEADTKNMRCHVAYVVAMAIMLTQARIVSADMHLGLNALVHNNMYVNSLPSWLRRTLALAERNQG